MSKINTVRVFNPAEHIRKKRARGNKVAPFVKTISFARENEVGYFDRLNAKDYQQRRIREAALEIDASLIQRSSAAIAEGEDKFTDPLSDDYKSRLGAMYEFDYTARSGTNIIASYVLGREPRATLYPVKSVRNVRAKSEIDAVLNDVISPQEQKDLAEFLDTVDHITRIYRKLYAFLVNCDVYGRGAILKERANESIESDPRYKNLKTKFNTQIVRAGMPLHLKPLSSFYLGQVYIDTITWEIKSVDYNDNSIKFSPGLIEDEQRPNAIPINSLIYGTVDDYHIVPNGLYYGLSRYQPILPISELNRKLNTHVYHEINENLWAGTGVFTVEGLDGDSLQELADSILPGTYIVKNERVQFQEFKLDYDIRGLNEEREKNIINMLRQLGLPSFIFNYENITNRATADTVAAVWQETVLEARRSWLRDILWEHYYKDLMGIFFGEAKEFLKIKLKIVAEFQNLSFASLFDKAIAIATLINAKVIDDREGRELIDYPPFTEDQLTEMERKMQLLSNGPENAAVNPDMGAETSEPKDLQNPENNILQKPLFQAGKTRRLDRRDVRQKIFRRSNRVT